MNEVKRDNESLLLIQEIQNSIVDLQMVRYILSINEKLPVSPMHLT